MEVRSIYARTAEGGEGMIIVWLVLAFIALSALVNIAAEIERIRKILERNR